MKLPANEIDKYIKSGSIRYCTPGVLWESSTLLILEYKSTQLLWKAFSTLHQLKIYKYPAALTPTLCKCTRITGTAGFVCMICISTNWKQTKCPLRVKN